MRMRSKRRSKDPIPVTGHFQGREFPFEDPDGYTFTTAERIGRQIGPEGVVEELAFRPAFASEDDTGL